MSKGYDPIHPILTKREYFAAMAMQGFCTQVIKEDMPDKTLAQFSVRAADALIKQLEHKADES